VLVQYSEKTENLKNGRKNVAIYQRSYERKDTESGSRYSTLLDERRIENGVVQGAVLSVTLFLVIMAGITDGTEEPITIIGYADNWMVHTKHQHQRVPTIRIQKAMNRIIEWAEDTRFKLSMEKTKAIMFSRRKFPITTRSKMNIWVKGEKIGGNRPRKPIKSTPNDSPQYTEEAVLKKLEPSHHKGIRFTLGAFTADSKTDNVLCKIRMTTQTEMRKLSNTKATIRVVTNKEHPKRPFCINPSKIDIYALQPETSTPIFIQAVEHLGTLQIDMRKI
jgi:hypothetical protein